MTSYLETTCVVVFVSFFAGAFFSLGRNEGHKEYFQGKVQCQQAFDKIICKKVKD